MSDRLQSVKMPGASSSALIFSVTSSQVIQNENIYQIIRDTRGCVRFQWYSFKTNPARANINKQHFALYKTCHLRKLLNIQTSPICLDHKAPTRLPHPDIKHATHQVAVMITLLFTLVPRNVTPVAHYKICWHTKKKTWLIYSCETDDTTLTENPT